MEEKKEVIKDISGELNSDVISFVGPDGNQYSIRERNGEDEDVISRAANANDGTAFNKFLQRIIVDFNGEGQMSHNQILSMKVRAKYFILLKSRIQSLGEEMVFTHTFQNGDKVEFTEDLSKFDFDYEKQELDELKDYHAKPFLESGEFFEFEISSGRNVRMRYLTNQAEMSLLGKDPTMISVNESLRARDIQVQTKEGDWANLNNLGILKSRETKEIRKKLLEMDPDFVAKVELKNPKNNEIEEVSLFLYQDFFFPMD